MALVACRSGIVGGEQSGIAEAVIHGAQIGRTRKDIVARIIWIATQTLLPTHCRPGAGHELHPSHRASPAGDRMAMQMGQPALSACMTAAIQPCGIPKRREASATSARPQAEKPRVGKERVLT